MYTPFLLFPIYSFSAFSYSPILNSPILLIVKFSNSLLAWLSLIVSHCSCCLALPTTNPQLMLIIERELAILRLHLLIHLLHQHSLFYPNLILRRVRKGG